MHYELSYSGVLTKDDEILGEHIRACCNWFLDFCGLTSLGLVSDRPSRMLVNIRLIIIQRAERDSSKLRHLSWLNPSGQF